MNQHPIPSASLLESLHWRYATKAFDPTRKIPQDLWATVEEALVLSPSSFGLQPYRFLVIHNPALREQMLPHSWGQRQVVDASHYVVFAARTTVTEGEIDTFLARTAATRGVPANSLAAYRGLMTGSLLSEGFKPLAPQWAARQAYIALGNLLTCAGLLGLDACPIEGFSAAEYDRLLDLPAQGLTSVVCCALGYRSPSDKYARLAKVRAPKTDLVKTL